MQLCDLNEKLLCLTDDVDVYKRAGYRGIPCVVLILDGVVVYVGSPQESFRPTLEQVLRVAETEFVRED